MDKTKFCQYPDYLKDPKHVLILPKAESLHVVDQKAQSNAKYLV